jgi:2-alkyl-3-oxoalkanoate reductase
MRIFVTGATGVVGRRVVPLLLKDGHQVTAIARSPEKRTELERGGAKAITVDLLDAPGVRRAVAGHDAIINLATHIPDSMMTMFMRSAWRENDRIRTEASAILRDAASVAGVSRFVQESFYGIYADGGDRWIDEQSPIAPVAYNRSVLESERAAERGVVLRFAAFYGPDSPFTHDMARVARLGWSPLPGSPDTFVSSVSHDDAARAVVAALNVPIGIYNVTDDEPLRRRDYCIALGARSVKFGPRWMTKLMGSLGEMLSRSHRLSNEKLKSASGWTPEYPSAREGLAFLHG